jgi:hypothetical protein
MGEVRMAMTRPLKKSETIEIRLPHPTKVAFMARCREDGRSASEALRGFIDGQIDGVVARRSPPWRLLAGAFMAAAAGAVALPSLAHTSEKAGFERFDANRDGRISGAEMRALDANGDGVVDRAEFAR